MEQVYEGRILDDERLTFRRVLGEFVVEVSAVICIRSTVKCKVVIPSNDNLGFMGSTGKPFYLFLELSETARVGQVAAMYQNVTGRELDGAVMCV